MKLQRLLTLTLVLSLAFSSIKAQDIHFSQFYMSPMNLNPALTGVMSCTHRLTANYRNQWASVLKSNAYNTYSVGYDMRVPVGRYDNFGWGVSFWGDKAGELNFATLEARLSAAYSKRMTGYRKKASYLVAGADVGVAQRSVDFLNAQYGTQNNNGNFDPNLPSLEEFDFNNFLFLDLTAGLLWYSIINENNNWYVGGAFSHLNRANQSFDDADDAFESLYSKITIHGGGEFMFSNRIGIVPGLVVLSQGPSLEINGGSTVKFRLGKDSRTYQAFHLGAWGRISNTYRPSIWMDAIILSARFDYESFSEVPLVFSPGDKNKDFQITILGDEESEPDENFEIIEVIIFEIRFVVFGCS